MTQQPMTTEQIAEALRGRGDSPQLQAVLQIVREQLAQNRDLAESEKTHHAPPAVAAYFNGRAASLDDLESEIIAQIGGGQ